MPSSKRRKIRAIEETNQNLSNPYEHLMGWGLAPASVDEDDFPPGEDRPDPRFLDVHRNNDSLVVSRRLGRIAKEMVKKGFKGA